MRTRVCVCVCVDVLCLYTHTQSETHTERAAVYKCQGLRWPSPSAVTGQIASRIHFQEGHSLPELTVHFPRDDPHPETDHWRRLQGVKGKGGEKRREGKGRGKGGESTKGHYLHHNRPNERPYKPFVIICAGWGRWQVDIFVSFLPFFYSLFAFLYRFSLGIKEIRNNVRKCDRESNDYDSEERGFYYNSSNYLIKGKLQTGGAATSSVDGILNNVILMQVEMQINMSY